MPWVVVKCRRRRDADSGRGAPTSFLGDTSFPKGSGPGIMGHAPVRRPFRTERRLQQGYAVGGERRRWRAPRPLRAGPVRRLDRMFGLASCLAPREKVENAEASIARPAAVLGSSGRSLLPSGYSPAGIAAAYGLDGDHVPVVAGSDGRGRWHGSDDRHHRRCTTTPISRPRSTPSTRNTTCPKITLDVIDQAGTRRMTAGRRRSRWTSSGRTPWPRGEHRRRGDRRPGRRRRPGVRRISWRPSARPAGRPGVSVVSMSWGYGEFPGEASYDSNFTTPGITYRRVERGRRQHRVAGDLVERPRRGRDLAHAVGVGRLRVRDRLVRSRRRPEHDPRPSPFIRTRVQSTGNRSTPDVVVRRRPEYRGLDLCHPAGEHLGRRGSGRSSAARAPARPPGPGSSRSPTRAARWPARPA